MAPVTDCGSATTAREDLEQLDAILRELQEEDEVPVLCSDLELEPSI